MKEMNNSSFYKRMFDVFIISHRKNKNSIKILIKFKKKRAIIEKKMNFIDKESATIASLFKCIL